MNSQLKHIRPLGVAVFFFFLTFYLATMPTDLPGGDSQNMFFVCQSLVERGDVNIWHQCLKEIAGPDDQRFEHGADGFLVSQFPITPSLVGVPFYLTGKWISRMLGRPLDEAELFRVVSVSGSVISALTCWLLFQFLLALDFGARTAVLATGCYGLGTIAWPHSHHLSTEPITTLAILGAVYAAYLYKIRGSYLWSYLSGFLSGVAASSRELSVMIVPLLLVYLFAVGWPRATTASRKSRWLSGFGRLVVFLLGLLPFLILNVWYTFARYGLMTNVDYLGHGGRLSDLFTNSLFVGLYGFLFSPGKSLFLYCPVLVLTFFAIPSFYRKHKPEFLLVFSIFLIHLLVYAKCSFWEGGSTFGPRYLLPVFPMLILVSASFLDTLPSRPAQTRILALLIFCLSVAVQTTPFWLASTFDWQMVTQIIQVLPWLVRESLAEFFPQAYPLLWTPRARADVLNQFYFLQDPPGSFRLLILLLLQGTVLSTGFYLVTRVRLVPRREGFRSLTAGLATRLRAWIRVFPAHKTAASAGALGVIVLGFITYGAFKYVLAPISQFNSKAFGVIDYPTASPNELPLVMGKTEVRGWALDRSGIRAVEIYIDGAKVADAQYGEPSPYVQALYPYIPNSGHAQYVATNIDTARFSDGVHALLVRALTQNGAWSSVSSAALYFVNETRYDFWSHLGEAELSAQDVVEDTELAIGQEPRRVLSQRADSTVSFEKIPVHEGAFLKLGVGLARGDGFEDTDDLLLEVLANSDKPLFFMYLNVKDDAENPAWHDTLIDLRPFRNQVISVTLRVRIRSGNKKISAHVGWSDLSIVYRDASENSDSA